jgi:hypothetical protein
MAELLEASGRRWDGLEAALRAQAAKSDEGQAEVR